MTEIEILHQAYCENTTFEIKLGYCREAAWHNFIKAGFTREDLIMVLHYLKRNVLENRWNPACLAFRNVVEQLDKFEENLALSKAMRRKFQNPTAKAKTLAALRPIVVEPPSEPRPRIAKEILQSALDQMRRSAQ